MLSDSPLYPRCSKWLINRISRPDLIIKLVSISGCVVMQSPGPNVLIILSNSNRVT